MGTITDSQCLILLVSKQLAVNNNILCNKKSSATKNDDLTSAFPSDGFYIAEWQILSCPDETFHDQHD